MASIMDMLADVSYEDNGDSVNEGAEAEDIVTSITESSSKTMDIFQLTDEEEEINDSTNISSFYTVPIILDEDNAAAVSEVITLRPKSSPLKSPSKIQSGNNTESDNNTDGENVTGLDPSQPEASAEEEEEREEEEREKEEGEKTVEFDPDNPDPDGPKFCHCQWGESGVMVECENCGEWYHDECIGLTEDETYNIQRYYCAPCCSNNITLVTKYKEDPVKLRQRIIENIRQEQAPKRPRDMVRKRRPFSGPEAEPDEDYDPQPAKQRKSRPPRVRAPKPPRVRAPWKPQVEVLKPARTPKPKVDKPKRIRVAKTERKQSPAKKNKILNRPLPIKRHVSSDDDKAGSDGDDEDDVAFVICEECGDSFPHKGALARHYTRKHEEHQTVRYQCDDCDKDFATTRALRDHEIIHSGVKPYSCMFCGDAFYHMSQLTAHTNSKHLNVRHQCDHCSRSYSNKPALNGHIKKAHGENADSD